MHSENKNEFIPPTFYDILMLKVVEGHFFVFFVIHSWSYFCCELNWTELRNLTTYLTFNFFYLSGNRQVRAWRRSRGHPRPAAQRTAGRARACAHQCGRTAPGQACHCKRRCRHGGWAVRVGGAWIFAQAGRRQVCAVPRGQLCCQVKAHALNFFVIVAVR